MGSLASHRCIWLVLLAVAGCVPAHAAIRMQIGTLDLPGATLAQVQASLAPGADGRPQLQLLAARVTVPALGWKDVALSLSGTPQRAGADTWRLDGTLALAHAPGDALASAQASMLIDTDAGSLDITLDQHDASLRALMPLDQPSHVQLSLKGLPLAWLQGALANAWASGRATGGTLGGEVALDIAPPGARISGRIDVAGGAFDSRSGTLAGQQLAARGTFHLDTTAPVARMDFDGALSGGQLLLGSLYAQLPKHSAPLQFAATAGAHGIAITALHYDDGDALDVDGKLDFDAQGNLAAFDFPHLDARLPDAYARYGSTWLATLGWKDLATAGHLSGSIGMARGKPTHFALHAGDVAVSDGAGRIVLSGLNGALDWNAQSARPATTLGWDSLALFGLPFGAAQLHFGNGADGALALAAPAQIPLLGGAFSLQDLAWRPAADRQDRLNASFAVSDIDVAALCKRFGWPAFGGTLGGAVPALRYSGDNILLDGGLSVHVFDGFVDVTSLSLQHPFGAAPVLAADVDLRQLDLGQLTGVFDFGSITGRLDGNVAGLRLVDWQPVAFDAALHADGGGRISQRALKSLTEVGGGGIGAGLQGMALNLFKTFGYSRIGLTCVLRAQVCTMGGIGSAGSNPQDGYTIVDGSGLPHISVIGHQREVDWPTLVDRLKAATQGNGPVVR